VLARLVLVAVAMGVAVGVAAVLRKRAPEAPTQGAFGVPTQIDRGDFGSTDAPWLVAVFSSSTCQACADVIDKARVLQSSEVAVVNVDYVADRPVHERYRIDAVPTLVIADARGVVLKSFLGPVKAQDLWAAMAECREPGSAPDGCEHHH
jgi:hypothetical protein